MAGERLMKLTVESEVVDLAVVFSARMVDDGILVQVSGSLGKHRVWLAEDAALSVLAGLEAAQTLPVSRPSPSEVSVLDGIAVSVVTRGVDGQPSTLAALNPRMSSVPRLCACCVALLRPVAAAASPDLAAFTRDVAQLLSDTA